jgi:hypothetical protein
MKQSKKQKANDPKNVPTIPYSPTSQPSWDHLGIQIKGTIIKHLAVVYQQG